MLLATLGVLLQLADPAGVNGDSVLRDARSAQARFERVRRANLPRRLSHRGGRGCHAQVGRYCYWYDPADTTVAPEPARIRGARLSLLASLDTAASALPGEPWLAGQRVRYLVEGGHLAEAVEVARACGAGWWCASLGGLVLHVAGRYLDADSAYALALRDMPVEQRCEWMDLSAITYPGWRRRFRAGDCAARARAAEALWAVSQPLWMLPGNDLRTEHLARHTMALVLERAANAHAMSFGRDSRELLLRYGWAEWFTRDDGSPGAYATYAVTGHDREPSFHFFPADVPEGAWHAIGPWMPDDTLAPSRYAPRHIEHLSALPHQLARFPRGDSTLLAVALAPPDAMRADSARTALVVHDGVPRVIARDGLRLTGAISRDTVIVGVEAYADGTRRAARARYRVAPPRCVRWCLSDLLLVRAGEAEHPALRTMLPRALVEPRITADTAFGTYFEIAGPAADRGTPAHFSLSVRPIRVSALRRAAAALRLASRVDPVRLRWAALIAPRDGVAPQYVALRLPASARGSYRVELSVAIAGETHVAAREIEVIR